MCIFLGFILACSTVFGATHEESTAITTTRWAHNPYSPSVCREVVINNSQSVGGPVLVPALKAPENLTAQSPQRLVRKVRPPLVFPNDAAWENIKTAARNPDTNLCDLMNRILKDDVRIAIPACDIGVLVEISERALILAGPTQSDRNLSCMICEDLIRFLCFSMSLEGANIEPVKHLQLNCIKSYLGLGNLMGIMARDARSREERNRNNRSAFAYFQSGFNRAIEFGLFKSAGTCFLSMSKLSYYLGAEFDVFLDECSLKLTVDFFLKDLGGFGKCMRSKDRNTIAGLFNKTAPQRRVL